MKSIVGSVDSKLDCELVVTDWESDDWPLKEWLEEAAKPIPVQIITLKGPFSRSKGLNIAAKAANGNYIMFLDADMLLCQAVINNGINYLCEGKGYFPVPYSFNGPEHELGWWRHYGYGNCMILKSIYTQSGELPEYHFWGREDSHFFSRVSSICNVIREEVTGFYHQWHPNEVDWKDQYVDKSCTFNSELITYVRKNPNVDPYLNQFLIALEELEKLIKPGEPFILVDDASFVNFLDPKLKFIPFLESNGEYWGRPPDDSTAIIEFERVLNSVINFMVFLWPAFWWLDHYSEFHQYLRNKYRCILENDRIVIFDLR